MSNRSDIIERVVRVVPAGGCTVRVQFAGSQSERYIDLTSFIARSEHFSALMDDSETFAKAMIVEDGLGLAWPVATKWGELDISAATLHRLADEQQPLTGETILAHTAQRRAP